LLGQEELLPGDQALKYWPSEEPAEGTLEAAVAVSEEDMDLQDFAAGEDMDLQDAAVEHP